MKRFVLLAAALCAALLLNACAAFAFQNTAELLRAPALGGGYDGIQNALAAYLEGADPQYKYPKEGDWRSPIIRADLDGDGGEEAVVLYGTDDSTAIGREKGASVYVAVMEYADGSWQVVCDEQGLDTDVASLEVADLLGSGVQQLIIGYSTPTLNLRNLALYTYADNTLARVYGQNYSRYEIGDFTGRGGNDLIVVSRDDDAGGMMLYYLPTKNGAFLLEGGLEPVKLDINFTSCAAIVPSIGREKEQLLLVDGVTAAGTGALATQIIHYAEGRFYAIDDGGATRGATARLNPLLTTRDINGDGAAEIPLRDGYNIIQTPAADKHLEYVQWFDFITNSAPAAKQFGILDADRSMYICLPDAWRGQISVEDGAEKGEWRIQSRRTLATLLAVRTVELGGSIPLNAVRVPGTTSGYLVFFPGVSAAERELVGITAMA